ncbi:hypothetical protein B7494_g7273 [Chlorociboria aeruginascens]|nr:hypothetical protein B7494_g7273 [Chlorociboria aeruginascens]
MKLSTTLLTLCFSTFVASKGFSIQVGGQKVLDDKGGPVPGENPLTYCKSDHDNDLFVIDHVNLNPNPPSAGASLSIDVVGELLEDIEKEAYVILQVKYGLIRLVNMQTDLCDQVSNVDLECPIKKGETTISKIVDLPNEIPPVRTTLLPVDLMTYSEDKEFFVSHAF